MLAPPRCLALALALAVLATAAESRAEAPLRARFVGVADAELEARVAGQTGDLEGWRIERERGPAPRGVEEALAAADGARVVFWVTGASGSLVVHVVDTSERRLLVRDVTGGTGESLA
ncbi:MAG: hypothetical protein AAGH15_09415, partial [Myxococcota bacterium]